MLAERSPCAVKGCVPASGSTCWATDAHPNVRNRLARNQRCIRRNWFGRSLAQRTLESRQQPARGRDWAHLTFVEPARGVAQISNLSASPGIASFGEVFQALAVARSVWSAWSLLPLSSLQPPTKAPASWTHSPYASRGSVAAVPAGHALNPADVGQVLMRGPPARERGRGSRKT